MANLRTDKVRAFLSSLPPGEVKLTLVRQRDVAQVTMETQESDKCRSVCDTNIQECFEAGGMSFKFTSILCQHNIT